MGEVSQVILIGDLSKGIDSGKVDVLVTGDNLNEDYILNLSSKIEEMIDKKVVLTLQAERMFSTGLVLFDREEEV